MKCPKCQLENREGAKFCKGCGIVLELACPNCGKVISPDGRFCDECGHDLSKPFVSNESLESSQQPDLRLDTSGPAVLPEGERRQTTVVFSDLSGYTAMNEQLDPKRWKGS